MLEIADDLNQVLAYFENPASGLGMLSFLAA